MESSRQLFAKTERCWAFCRSSAVQGPRARQQPSKNKETKRGRRQRTHGRPSAHFPAIDRLEFAFSTTLSWMYTPYLFAKVVLVPFQAVMPPPQPRSAS